MVKNWNYAAIAMVLGVAGYALMPDGPWFREFGAGLCLTSAWQFWTDAKATRANG